MQDGGAALAGTKLAMRIFVREKRGDEQPHCYRAAGTMERHLASPVVSADQQHAKCLQYLIGSGGGCSQGHRGRHDQQAVLLSPSCESGYL